MVFSEVDLCLCKILLGRGEKQEVRLLEVALDAEAVAVHDAEAVVRLTVALDQ